MNIDTKALRQHFKTKRAHLSTAFVAHCSQKMCAKIARSKVFEESQHIAVYFSHLHEIDLSDLIELAHRRNKKLYLPVIREMDHKLQFRRFHKQSRMRVNHFGIPEPLPTRRVTSIQKLDLVLTPLLAFTKKGIRLGMGKGFYDRTFAQRNRPGSSRKPFLLGCAYEWQCVENLPFQDWDVKLDGVVTEKSWYGKKR